MILEIKGLQGVDVNSTTVVGRGFIDVNLIGVEEQQLLQAVSIEKAIEYYGETELLDRIGKQAIQDHIDSRSEEEN